MKDEMIEVVIKNGTNLRQSVSRYLISFDNALVLQYALMQLTNLIKQCNASII